MSMTISHGCYSGSAIAFHKWRTMLGKLIGVEMPQAKYVPGVGIVGWEPPPSVPPQDDLMILLDHPDYKGFIAPEDCLKVADRLEQLLPQVGDYEMLTQQFIHGLRSAGRVGEQVLFNIGGSGGDWDDEEEEPINTGGGPGGPSQRSSGYDMPKIQTMYDDLFS